MKIIIDGEFVLFLGCYIVFGVFAASPSSLAQEPDLTTITVTPSGYDEQRLRNYFLPKEENGKLFEGKKASNIKLSDIPEISTNNSRQLFSRTPGLLVSEVSNESFLSLSYRGLGDPHETFNLNVLADEIPLNADPYGYPAVYFAPPFDYVDTVQFTRGGAALLYGPQPGGALNFITREPSSDPFAFRTKQVVGSKGLYNTYNEVAGSKDGVEYLAAYHRRQSDGFRVRNSDYQLDYGTFKVGGQLTDRTHIMFNQDIYQSSFGEPGGLSLERGENVANYQDDRWQTSLNSDNLAVSRYMSSLHIEHELSASTKLISKTWAGYLDRTSRRQAYGTAPSFGGIANGTTNNIQSQKFTTIGNLGRFAKDWALTNDKDSTFVLGYQLFGSLSPYSQETGKSPDAVSGDLTRKIDRETFTTSVFAENRFGLGDFTITPGMRFENIYQSIDEKFNSTNSENLRDTSKTNTVPLFGLGLTYDISNHTQAYANVSQSYKPVTFQDTLPLGPTDQISSDINESKATNFELGIKGNPVSTVMLDVSTFYINYSNQFGRVGPQIGNTGKAKYYGVDISTDISLSKLVDQATSLNLENTLGSFSLYSNASILKAEFTEGPLEGKTPQYAPDYIIRTGAIYAPYDVTKIALLGSFLDSHFADDGNTANFAIPSYRVWDLTADISLIKDRLSLTSGINNLFDQNYYSRIRSNGIDPALPRNFYIGFNAYF